MGGSSAGYTKYSNGVVLNAETGVVRQIEPSCEITFACYGQSFQKTSGEIVSLVETPGGVFLRMICYNQADDKVTTIKNFGSKYC